MVGTTILLMDFIGSSMAVKKTNTRTEGMAFPKILRLRSSSGGVGGGPCGCCCGSGGGGGFGCLWRISWFLILLLKIFKTNSSSFDKYDRHVFCFYWRWSFSKNYWEAKCYHTKLNIYHYLYSYENQKLH